MKKFFLISTLLLGMTLALTIEGSLAITLIGVALMMPSLLWAANQKD